MSGFIVRSIDPDEREECLALWCTAFPHTSRAYFERYFYGDTEYDPHYTRVGVLEGRLVSCVQIVRRVVTVGEARLTAACIANVSTLPQFTGRGYNRACLESALNVISKDTFDFSILGTGIPNYYAKFGWAQVGLPVISGQLRDVAMPPDTKLRQARFSDVEQMMAAYTLTYQRVPLSVVRSRSYWRGWLEFSEGANPDMWYVAETPAGEFLGYVRAEKDDESSKSSLDIYEAASLRPFDANLVSRLFRAAAEYTGCDDGVTCNIHVPPTSAVAHAAATLLLGLKGSHGGGMMFRIVNNDNLLMALLPEINDRWVEAGRPSVDLAIENPDGPPLSLTTDDHGLRLQLVSQPQNMVIPQASAFQLLFGLEEPSAVQLPTGTEAARALLSARCRGTYLTADDF